VKNSTGIFFSVLTCVVTCFAAPPGPGDSRAFKLQGIRVYNVSGTRYDTDGSVYVVTSVSHLGSGQLVGTGEAYYSDGFVELEAVGPLKGSVRGGGMTRYLNFGFQAPISGSDEDGQSYSGNYSLIGSAKFDLISSSAFYGVSRSRYCIRGEGCGKEQGLIYIPQGSGLVTVNFTNMQVNGSAVTGEAVVEVCDAILIGGAVYGACGSGANFSYSITGQFNSAKSTYALRLQGHGSATGSSFIARCTDSESQGFNLEKLSGRLLGQTVRYKKPED
jgi:hypothetical protein